MKSARSTQELVLEPEGQEPPACQHHWMIDKPAGPVSRGVCRACGEERDFRNYVEGSAWGNDITLDQLAGRSRIPSGLNLGTAKEGSVADEDA